MILRQNGIDRVVIVVHVPRLRFFLVSIGAGRRDRLFEAVSMHLEVFSNDVLSARLRVRLNARAWAED